MDMHRARLSTRVWMLCFALVLAILCAGSALAQAIGYDLSWYTTDGGGGTSRGADYTLSGTIGQPEAGGAAGSNYTLVGGFWTPRGGVGAPGLNTLFVPFISR